MRHTRAGVLVCLIGLLTLVFVAPPEAQTGHPWGVGSFGGITIPVFGTGERFSGTPQYGGTLHYQYSSRMMMEIEYHHSAFKNGKEAKRPFTWALDQKPYYSPLAVSRMRFNSALLNLLITPGSPGFETRRFAFYVTVGTGVYGYKAERRNFIFPGQTTLPLNTTLYLRPQVDERAALGLNAGLGGHLFLSKAVALDMRARYHVVIGELRPFAAWGFDKPTMPLQFLEVGAGLKFFFRKS